jgi:hypothetical protein
LAFAVFLSLMKKKYRSTFWSMETGNEWVQSYFLRGEIDDIKANVLTKNRAKWKAIEPQVEEWVREGWMRWVREKPAWFSDNWKARVPSDWVPKEGKAEHRKARESVRKASVLHVPRLSRVSAGAQGAVASINGSAKKISGVFNSGKKIVLVREEEEEEEEEEEAEEEQNGGAAEATRGGGRVQPVMR